MPRGEIMRPEDSKNGFAYFMCDYYICSTAARHIQIQSLFTACCSSTISFVPPRYDVVISHSHTLYVCNVHHPQYWCNGFTSPRMIFPQCRSVGKQSP